jgi:hypothetical protein
MTAEETMSPGERDFRTPLAKKLAARGYEAAALSARVDELLKRGGTLRRDVEKLLQDP